MEGGDGVGRAPRGLVDLINFYLRFPNRGRGTFSCLSKRKYPKRRHPEWRKRLLRAAAFGALAESQHILVL